MRAQPRRNELVVNEQQVGAAHQQLLPRSLSWVPRCAENRLGAVRNPTAAPTGFVGWAEHQVLLMDLPLRPANSGSGT